MPNNLRSDDENENLREQVDYRIRSETIQKLYPCVTRANKNENKKKISLIFSGQFEKINIESLSDRRSSIFIMLIYSIPGFISSFK